MSMIPALALAAALVAAAQTASSGAVTVINAAPQTPKPAEPRKVCRISMETGSLVRRSRRCDTAKAWNRAIDRETRAARDLVARSSGLIISN